MFPGKVFLNDFNSPPDENGSVSEDNMLLLSCTCRTIKQVQYFMASVRSGDILHNSKGH